jgi:hypothetical protein
LARAPRNRRPAPTEEPTSGATRWLAGAVLALVALIALGRLGSTPEPVAVAPPLPDSGAVVAQPAPAVRAPAPPPVAPGPAVAPASATPTLDLMVQLEARRRIGRAGRLVYLDSLFAESDSTLRRWPERPGQAVTVAIVRDSLYSAAGEPDQLLRDAFGRWTALPLGIQLEFVGDTVGAEIVVGWIRQFAPEDRRTGQTDIEVAPDGTIRTGRITLALVDPTGRRLDRNALLVTATHEVGHALGLAHSGATSDLMYPSPRSATLSDRDTQTALLIYGLPPGSIKGQ